MLHWEHTVLLVDASSHSEHINVWITFVCADDRDFLTLYQLDGTFGTFNVRRRNIISSIQLAERRWRFLRSTNAQEISFSVTVGCALADDCLILFLYINKKIKLKLKHLSVSHT